MSFTKKISDFLNEAKAQDLIDQDVSRRLQHFAKTYDNKSGIGSFLDIVGFFGGLAIILGLILIISHNWSEIPNYVKISSYIISLVGFHLLAYRIQVNYPKVSYILYFIGAGYVIAGIGLISQIYHLSSHDGREFLMWFVMILPLALILRHKWIGAMSMLGFYLWLNINSSFDGNEKSYIIYLTTISTSMILVPRIFGFLNDCFNHVKFFGIGLLILIVLVMGFSHEILSSKAEGIILNPITVGILIFNLITLSYLLLTSPGKDESSLLSSRYMAALLTVINLSPFIMYGDSTLILVSIFYWIIWFGFGVVMMYQGSIKENRLLINLGTWCVMIGIILRFIDIVGTMLFTGSVFVLFGSILMGVAFGGEKYRKYLINQITPSHAAN